MEQVLFLLFVLFSIVSWLLERRKKAKQVEEQRRRREQQQQEPEPSQIEVEEEDEEVAWPFGGTLVEEEQSQESMAEAAEAGTLASEREALVAERRALEVERMALEVARQASGQQSPQRMTDLLRKRAEQEQPASSRPLQIGKWKIDPEKARDAIVYAEILGKPKAERREGD
jgi:hypothetical protein